MMLWLILSLLAAASSASISIFSKLGLKDMDEYLTSWLLRVTTSLLMLPLVLINGPPTLSSQFFYALLIGGSLNTLSVVLYMKSLKNTDVSMAMPLMNLTPLFLLLTSPLMLGEFPTMLGLAGIFAITAGVYILNLGYTKQSIFAPVKALLKNKGQRYMLVAAFIWSITSNYDKIGAVASSTLFWVFSINAYCSILLTPIVLRNCQFHDMGLKRIKPMIFAGVMHTLMSIFQIAAITMTLVAYVIAIKRMNTLISVLLARFVLKEKNTGTRVVGSVLMLFGVVLISIFG